MNLSIVKLTAITCLLTTFSWAAVAADQQGATPKIQIIVEGSPASGLTSSLISTRGNKHELTLGTLLNETAESYMGTPKDVKTDPKAIAYLTFDKNGDKVNTVLHDKTGRSENVDLGVLIAAVAEAYPGCNADQIDGKTVNIPLVFRKDSNGHVEAFFQKQDKTEVSFNLGVLMNDVTALLNNCK